MSTIYAQQGMDLTAPLHILASSNEEDLVRRSIAGERTAQRQLFERHKRRVHATLFRILGSNQSLDDLLQDVFLSVFRSLHTFRWDASLSTWIDRCAVRAALGHLRSRRGHRHLELVAENMPSHDPSAERRALARDAARRLYDLLDRLDPTYRAAFALHAIEGRSVAEVAELMQATVVATKARVWRARRYVERRAKTDPVLAEYVVGDAKERHHGLTREVEK